MVSKKDFKKKEHGSPSTEGLVVNLYSRDQLIDIVDKLKTQIKEIEKEIKTSYPYVSRLNLKLTEEGKERIDTTTRMNMDPEVKLAHVKVVYDNLNEEFKGAREENTKLKNRLEEIEKEITSLNTTNQELEETIKEKSTSDCDNLRAKLGKLKLKEQRLKTKLDEILEAPFFKESENLKTKMLDMRETEQQLEALLKDIEELKLTKNDQLLEIEKLESQEIDLDKAISEINNKIAE